MCNWCISWSGLQVEASPGGAKENSQGRKPLVQFRDRPESPGGAKEVSFAPPGLEIAMVLVSQGLAPLAIGFRPSGTLAITANQRNTTSHRTKSGSRKFP